MSESIFFGSRVVAIPSSSHTMTWVSAKSDTGAKRSSIDATLAAELDLELVGRLVTTVSSNGSSRRELAILALIYNSNTYLLEVNLTNPGHLTCPVLLGMDWISQAMQIEPACLSCGFRSRSLEYNGGENNGRL